MNIISPASIFFLANKQIFQPFINWSPIDVKTQRTQRKEH